MKRALLVSSGLLFLAVAAQSLPGCGGPPVMPCWMLAGECITYEKYLSIDQTAIPTPTVESVIAALGTPKEIHDRNGKRRTVDYHAYSLNGDMKLAVFTFDDNEKLVKKELW
jgi:hypothetical protein